MGTKKWAEIKKLSKATEADRAEARAELGADLAGSIPPPLRTIRSVLNHAEGFAQRFEEFDPAQGSEVPVNEYLAQPRLIRSASDFPPSGGVSGQT